MAYVNVEWNDLTTLSLNNLNFLQRVNAANNQLTMVDVSFDPLLTTINLTYNDMLTDLRTTGDSQLTHVIGYNEWDPYWDN